MASDTFRLDDEVALITGGGTGIGLGIARCFIRAGARVILVGRRQEPLRKAREDLGKAAVVRVHDVTERHATDRLLHDVQQEAGPVSILVNNAGVHLRKAATETSAEDFDAVLQTHVVAAHDLTRAVLPAMIHRRHGNVLFIASMSSFFGVPLVLAYSAAKSAYLGMVRCLAVEASPHGVRVNAIAPGWIDTPMLRRTVIPDEKRMERILGRTPMNRFGTPEDIGWAATYLCSDAAGFVTGAVLPVDGGASIGF